MTLKHIVVIGAGTMGRGIAQWFAQQLIKVDMVDINFKLSEDSLSMIHSSWEKLLQKGKFSQEQIDQFKKYINICTFDNIAKDADLVIEAIIENLKIKKELFLKLDHELNAETIIATNTSSFPIASLANHLSQKRSARFLGLHFFNPAPIMKLVEVIKGHSTDQKIIDQLFDWFKNAGKEPAKCLDSPGFIVNRVARNFYGESLRLTNHFDPQKFYEIDYTLKKVVGLKMGPFELMDLIGIDINYSVTKSVWEAYYHNPRFTPHPLQKLMVDANALGNKTNLGFLCGQEIIKNELPIKKSIIKSDIQLHVMVEHQHPYIEILQALEYNLIIIREGEENGKDLHQFSDQLTGATCVIDLVTSNTKNKSELLNNLQKIYSGPIICEMGTLWGEAIALEFSQVKGAISLLVPSPHNIAEYWISADADQKIQDIIQTFYQDIDLEGTQVATLGFGMIALRVMAMIINEAYFALEENVASAIDIDTAMKFGVNYPHGPFYWCQKIRPHNVVHLLDDLKEFTGDGRYQVALGLRKAAIKTRSKF